MHEAGLAHCDLKPGNVVLTPGGDAKLADFGAACAINSHTGRLATMHGNVMRDREIERLMKHHMNHRIRDTEDSLSAFGSAWGGARNSNNGTGLSSVQSGVRDSSRGETPHNSESTGCADHNSSEHCIWTMSNPTVQERPPPFVLQGAHPEAASVPETVEEDSVSLFPERQVRQQQQQLDVSTAFVDEKARPEYTRHIRTQSSLLRSFRSCPGSSAELDSSPYTPEPKAERRGVRWLSGSSGSQIVPERDLPSRSAGDALLATQRSSLGSCSRIKAYSLRDVPMVCLLM